MKMGENVQRPTSNVQLSSRKESAMSPLPLNVERWTLDVERFSKIRSSTLTVPRATIP